MMDYINTRYSMGLSGKIIIKDVAYNCSLNTHCICNNVNGKNQLCENFVFILSPS